MTASRATLPVLRSGLDGGGSGRPGAVRGEIPLGAGRALWFMVPKDGRINRLATMPVLESVIPLAIVGGFAVGLGFILAVFVK